MQRRTAAALSAFAVVFIALSVSSYTQKSATWDEPQHLTAGYLALRAADWRTDPEHPPFLRMWAALPLLLMRGIRYDTAVIDPVPPEAWAGMGQFEYAHWFLYKLNDADRLLYAARFMIVLLGVLLGVLLFAWANELFGFWPATVALALYTLEPNLLAHSGLVTTDFGLTCFAFGTVYFAWRYSRRPGAGNLAGLAGFFALAQASKFSALLLGPVVAALLLARRLRELGRVAAVCVLLALASWVVIWAVYGFRHRPSDSPGWRFDFRQSELVMERVPRLGKLLGWMDERRLLPNAYLQGLLLGQAKAQKRAAFFAGEYSTEGWWYFFPVAFLMKVPVAVLGVFAAGLVMCAREWRKLARDELFVLVPFVVFFAAAMAAKLNIGLRHVLPVFPFALLVGAKLFQQRRWLRVGAPVVLLLAAAELARVYPHYLAFFNQLVGGPRNGHRFLVDSNLDWGQDLKTLKRWMDAHGVQQVNLSYFGTADPDYYKIRCTHLPGAPFFARVSDNVALPGHVAVSATNLRGVYLGEEGRQFYRPLSQQKPVTVLGYSIFVYWVERPWW
jgi:hypothetical protein